MTSRRPIALTDLLAQAVHGLLAHRLRTTLSSIGVVFGVATVVAALAVGEGARRDAMEQIGSLGIDNVFVRAVPGVPGRPPSAPALTLADARHLASTLAGVREVSAIRSTRATLTAGRVREDAALVGATVTWSSVSGASAGAGRWLTPDDERARRRVMVLGDRLARTLFGHASPLGRRVLAGTDSYQIVGVLASAEQQPRAAGQAHRFLTADAAFVPLAAMDVRLGEGDRIDLVEEIGLRTAGADHVERVAAGAGAIVARRHPRQAGWEIVVPRELLELRLRALRTFNAVLFGIGTLALVISGIGIMNMMLASVAERTAEIGVCRAFGATRQAIVTQFAIEAALVCGAGGAAGVVAGVLLAALIAILAGWPIAVSAATIVMAVSMAGATGVAFGVYPARRAARLDPVEALRAP